MLKIVWKGRIVERQKTKGNLRMRQEYRIIATGLAAVLAVNIYAPIHVKASLFPAPIVVSAEENTRNGIEWIEGADDTTDSSQVTLETEASAQSAVTAQPQENSEEQAVYQDGVILLYTYEQLCAVGSGQQGAGRTGG